MKKFKFNAKLTAFLVSLFLGLVFVILGSKFKICLSFGLMLISASLILYLWYDKEKSSQIIVEFEDKINEITEDEEIEEDEKIYIIGQLSNQQKSILKRSKRINFLFAITAFTLFVLAIINFF